MSDMDYRALTLDCLTKARAQQDHSGLQMLFQVKVECLEDDPVIMTIAEILERMQEAGTMTLGILDLTVEITFQQCSFPTFCINTMDHPTYINIRCGDDRVLLCIEPDPEEIEIYKLDGGYQMISCPSNRVAALASSRAVYDEIGMLLSLCS